MSSNGLNILRYGALVFGVFYGITHQQTIKAAASDAQASHEYQRKHDLIEKAKAEFQKKHSSPQQQQQNSSSGSGAISDPEDPNFDLEAYLNKVAESN